MARHGLGCVEGANRHLERGMKHWIIAAKLGCDDSLNALKTLYEEGLLSKDDFSAALRGYQTAIEATKSPQRDEAVAFAERMQSVKGKGI